MLPLVVVDDRTIKNLEKSETASQQRLFFPKLRNLLAWWTTRSWVVPKSAALWVLILVDHHVSEKS